MTGATAPLRGLAAFLLVTGVATSALADGDGVPSFARNKRRVDAVDHPPGNHVEALPAIAYDPTLGLELGAVAFYTMNGAAKDPLFPVTPYRDRVYAQAVFSTKGYQQHILSYDGLYIRGMPFRLRASVVYERNTAANYFGVGEQTLGDLSFQGQTHGTFDEQAAAASALRGRTASPLYNHYHYEKPSASLTLERELLGGLVRVQYGFVGQHVSISRFDGTQTQGADAAGNLIDATHGPTKLGLDCATGAIVGCDGGWNNILTRVSPFRRHSTPPFSGRFLNA